jgi:hypothetical protein
MKSTKEKGARRRNGSSSLTMELGQKISTSIEHRAFVVTIYLGINFYIFELEGIELFVKVVN